MTCYCRDLCFGWSSSECSSSSCFSGSSTTCPLGYCFAAAAVVVAVELVRTCLGSGALVMTVVGSRRRTRWIECRNYYCCLAIRIVEFAVASAAVVGLAVRMN